MHSKPPCAGVYFWLLGAALEAGGWAAETPSPTPQCSSEVLTGHNTQATDWPLWKGECWLAGPMGPILPSCEGLLGCCPGLAVLRRLVLGLLEGSLFRPLGAEPRARGTG